MELNIKDHMNKLSEVCDTFGVRRLEIFGSGSRQDFNPRQSDIDFLVEFIEVHQLGAFERYFGLKEVLEQLFKCSVDLVEEKTVNYPYFRQAIDQERIQIYGTGR